MKTDTQTLIAAMRLLAKDIETDDGVANAAIAEAADRLDEMRKALCIIATWTKYDSGSSQSRQQAMSSIEALCEEVLR